VCCTTQAWIKYPYVPPDKVFTFRGQFVFHDVVIGNIFNEHADIRVIELGGDIEPHLFNAAPINQVTMHESAAGRL
jgi:hypothetical protein